MKLFVICLVLGATLAATNQRRRLTRSLVENYDKLSPPQVKDDLPLNVSHNLQLIRIVGLEDRVLTLDMYVSTFWQDDQLTWDTDDFGGINAIRLPSELVWKPDIMLENDADRSSGPETSGINIVVYANGSIIYVRPMKIQSYCSTDHIKMKRNSHVKCSLKFMSWTYDAQSINLFNADESQILANFDAEFNKEWKVVDHSVTRNVKKYDCCPDAYIDLEYEFGLETL